MAVEEVEMAQNEIGNLRKELETLEGHKMEDPKVMLEQLWLALQLLEWSVEQDFVQAKVNLKVHRAVEFERCKWEDVEKKLLDQLTEANDGQLYLYRQLQLQIRVQCGGQTSLPQLWKILVK